RRLVRFLEDREAAGLYTRERRHSLFEGLVADRAARQEPHQRALLPLELPGPVRRIRRAAGAAAELAAVGRIQVLMAAAARLLPKWTLIAGLAACAGRGSRARRPGTAG